MKPIFKNIFLWIGTMAICGACQPPDSEKINYYYDITKPLQKQILVLQNTKPLFVKTNIAKGKSETREVSIREWQKELALFLQADINKSAFRDMYEEISTQNAQVLLKTFVGKDSSLEVKHLKVGLDTQNSDLLSVEVLIHTDNYLFSSQKQLKLSIAGGQLQYYEIKGQQKMIFAAPQTFEIKAQRKY